MKVETKFNLGDEVYFVSFSEQSQKQCKHCDSWIFEGARRIPHVHQMTIDKIQIEVDSVPVNHMARTVKYKEETWVMYNGQLGDHVFATREEAEAWGAERS